VCICVCVCMCVFPGEYNDHNRKVEESYPQNQVTFARCYTGWFQLHHGVWVIRGIWVRPRIRGKEAEDARKVNRIRGNEIMRERERHMERRRDERREEKSKK